MTVANWRTLAAKRLEAAGDMDAKTDSSLFLCAVLNCDPGALRLKLNESLDDGQLYRLNGMLARREQGEPEQYIEGAAYFMGLKFKIDSRALIPRFDTETLCEAAIADIGRMRAPRVLDMCAGSGCIAVSVAKFCPDAMVTASDISAEALALAGENAALNGVALERVQGDGFEKVLDRKFDAVLCNPPYLSDADMVDLQRELQFEPRAALYGGKDGLKFYRRFAVEMRSCLKARALVLFEVGQGQAGDVSDMLSQAYPKAAIDTIKDLNGVRRAVRMRL